MKNYMTFKRTWWKHNPKYPTHQQGLEHELGEKLDKEYWDTEEEAWNHCRDMNNDPTNFPNPNPYSMKYEFKKLS